MIELLVATRNKKKFREIKDLLSGLRFRITSLADYPFSPRIAENAKTFRGNASKKAVKIASFSGKLTLGEDSGLCVDSLGGKPGIYSSRFSGRAKDDLKNNRKLLKLLEGLPLKKRRAHYVCAVALADKTGLLAAVEGKCSGYISCQMKGRHGFGYDPLFIVPVYKRTFGELGERIKHKISHRYRALEKARPVLKKYIEKQNRKI